MQDAAALLCLLFAGLQLIDYELTSGILKRGRTSDWCKSNPPRAPLTRART